MRKTLEKRVRAELKQLIDGGPVRAESAATELDTTVYTSLERHRDEVAAIAAHPMAALAASEVANPGDFRTIDLAGVPIIVVRDRDGVLHAFHNACAHRGSTVEQRTEGSARIFSCGFHGWSYQLDGSLRAVADAPLFSNAPCDKGLHVVPCEERHGLVWVTPRPSPSNRSVEEWLGEELDELFEDLGLRSMVHHAAIEYELDCNWKLLTDGFLEIYHLKYLHRDSIAPYFPANLSSLDRRGEHFFTLLPKNRLVDKIVANDAPKGWSVLDDLTSAITLVPGTVVQWQAGHVELFSLRPHTTDPAKSTVRLTMLVPGERAHETDLWDRNWERVNVTIPDEDFAAAVDVQGNIDAGVVPSVQIGANEHYILEHLAAVERLSLQDVTAR